MEVLEAGISASLLKVQSDDFDVVLCGLNALISACSTVDGADDNNNQIDQSYIHNCDVCKIILGNVLDWIRVEWYFSDDITQFIECAEIAQRGLKLITILATNNEKLRNDCKKLEVFNVICEVLQHLHRLNDEQDEEEFAPIFASAYDAATQFCRHESNAVEFISEYHGMVSIGIGRYVFPKNKYFQCSVIKLLSEICNHKSCCVVIANGWSMIGKVGGLLDDFDSKDDEFHQVIQQNARKVLIILLNASQQV
jgi:hypothetical protein